MMTVGEEGIVTRTVLSGRWWREGAWVQVCIEIAFFVARIVRFLEGYRGVVRSLSRRQTTSIAAFSV